VLRASARRSPPVSAMTGAVNSQCLETTRTRLQALCPLTQRAAWRGAAGLCSSATQPPVSPSGRGRKPNDQRRGRASEHGHLLRLIESWWKSFAPYIHHTAKHGLKQLRVLGEYNIGIGKFYDPLVPGAPASASLADTRHEHFTAVIKRAAPFQELAPPVRGSPAPCHHDVGLVLLCYKTRQ
jgi:hypothetical protein